MAELAQSPRFSPIIQFSLFADNKIGRLHQIVAVLASNDVHVMALGTQDTTECTIMRFIVDYPEAARELFREHNFSFCEHEMLGVEIETEQQIRFVTAALTEAEINIHYVYAFLMRPGGRCGLAISLEDNELAAQVLGAHGIRVLTQSDIAR